MDEEIVVIQLELTVAGASLTGRASSGTGPAHAFSGRLGLMATIDELLDLGRQATDGSGPDGPGRAAA